MKYALLSVSCTVRNLNVCRSRALADSLFIAQMQISFDVNKITSFEDASAPFILYNSTRLSSVIRKFEVGVESGAFPAAPAVESMGPEAFAPLTDQREWELLMEYVLPFAWMIETAAMPTLPAPPALPDYGTHKVCDFLNSFTRSLSAYYGPAGVRILVPTKDSEGNAVPAAEPAAVAAMHARIHLCQAFRQVIDNGLRLLMITPLERM